MNSKPEAKKNTSIAKSFAIALSVTVVFWTALLILLIVSIVTVNGDGTAPWLSNIIINILPFTVRLLGVSSGGSLFTVIFFWSIIVFAVVFMFVSRRGTVAK